MTLDPSEFTVNDLRKKLDEIDDPAELQAIREAERDGMGRKTARQAIDRRLEAIGAGETPGGQRPGEQNLRTIAMEDAHRATERLDAWLASSQ